jgi:hypothetical protein
VQSTTYRYCKPISEIKFILFHTPAQYYNIVPYSNYNKQYYENITLKNSSAISFQKLLGFWDNNIREKEKKYDTGIKYPN